MTPVARINVALARYYVPVPAVCGDLGDRVARAWEIIERGDTLTLDGAAELVTTAQRHRAAYAEPGPDADRAACLLAQAYGVAAEVLRRAGLPDRAWFADDRARATGDACGCQRCRARVAR